MSSETMRQILQMIEEEVNSRPSAIEFEMAYQIRVAIDRIRFAIKHSERFPQPRDGACDANLQLLEALERLERVERRFQERSQFVSRLPSGKGTEGGRQATNGPALAQSDWPANGPSSSQR